MPLFRSRRSSDRHYRRLVRRVFGVRPHNLELYKMALIHKSASVVVAGSPPINNERLEFLGDAVLESVVSEMLFLRFPQANEGFLSQLRARMVSRSALNRLATDLGLAREVVAHSSRLLNDRNNLPGDAFEALVGALYLDKGYDRTNRVLLGKIFARDLDVDAVLSDDRDFKSRLIEWAQKNRISIEFRSRAAEDHADSRPHFVSTVLLGGQPSGHGEDRSKKEAEQLAARMACAALLER